MMGLCRWKWTMQATSDLVAFWNSACRMFLQSLTSYHMRQSTTTICLTISPTTYQPA